MVLTKTNYIPIYHYLRKLDFSQLKSGDSGWLPLPTHDFGRGNQLPTTWPMSLDQSFYAVPKSQLPTNSARSSEIICANWDPPWTVNTSWETFQLGGVLYCIVATPQKKSRDANGPKHGWRSMTNVLHVQEPSWRKVTTSAWFLPLKLSTSGFQPVNPVSSGACKTLSSWDEVFVSWSSVVFSWYILWSMFVGGMATWGFPDLLGHVLLGPFKAWETCCGVAEGSHDGRSPFRGRERNESRSTFFHEWLVFFRHPSEKYGG